MLAAHEFAVGLLGEAQPGTLVLPRNKHEATFIVGERGDQTIAMFLDGDHKFGSFPSSGNEAWAGLLVPDVQLIVDPASLFDPDNDRAPLGSVVRGGTYLSLMAKSGDRYGFQDSIHISLRDDLAAQPSNLKAGFVRWQVVLGNSQQRRVLFEMDLRTPAENQ